MPTNSIRFSRLIFTAGFISFVAPSLTACFSTSGKGDDDDNSTSCKTDDDCKRSELCVQNACVIANDAGGTSSATGGGSNATGGAGGTSSSSGGSVATGGSNATGGAGGTPSATGGSSATGGNGTASGGTGGSSSASGGASGTAGTGGTAPSCAAPVTSGAVALTTGYLPPSVIGDGGFAYTFTDENGSTACVDDAALCVSGKTAAFSTDVWGAAVGFHLNQANSEAAPVGTYPATATSGLIYSVSALPAQGLRLQIDDGGVSYCVALKSASGTVEWTQFNTSCWDDTGTFMSGGPSTATQIAFLVPSGTLSGAFDFCVTRIAFDTTQPTPPAQLLGVGSACTSNSQCASGACAGWCTAGCVQNTDCGINSYGQLDWCVEDAAAIDSCFPGCESNADCAVYGANISCKPVTATNGATALVCSS